MSRRILIVDDSEVIRSRLRSLLCDLRGNVELRMAGNVRQAMLSLESEPPNVVILDLSMPDGSGLDVLQDIKRRFPDVVVTILTNYPHAAYRARCAELGADFFFDKSTEFDRVKLVIQQDTDDACVS